MRRTGGGHCSGHFGLCRSEGRWHRGHLGRLGKQRSPLVWLGLVGLGWVWVWFGVDWVWLGWVWFGLGSVGLGLVWIGFGWVEFGLVSFGWLELSLVSLGWVGLCVALFDLVCV